MYNDNCKQEGCSVPVSVDSMKNVIVEIQDNAFKAREMAFDIYKKLFGTLPSSAEDGAKIECAFDATYRSKSWIHRHILKVVQIAEYTHFAKLGYPCKESKFYATVLRFQCSVESFEGAAKLVLQFLIAYGLQEWLVIFVD